MIRSPYRSADRDPTEHVQGGDGGEDEREQYRRLLKHFAKRGFLGALARRRLADAARYKPTQWVTTVLWTVFRYPRLWFSSRAHLCITTAAKTV